MGQNLTDIQQDFVRRFMDNDGIVGVRIRRCDGEIVLFVEVEDGHTKLPKTFRGLRVVVKQGQRAMLAYC